MSGGVLHPTIGVVLMSFGSVTTPEEVPDYLSRVRGGRPIPKTVVVEMQRRYRSIGGSPLLRITREQASALEALLNDDAGEAAPAYRVTVGMRYAPPYVSDALSELAAAGIRRVVGIIMAPQHSPIIMGGYHRAVDDARGGLPSDLDVRIAGAWHTVPSFLGALARRVEEALGGYSPADRDRVQVLMTAHSLPKGVVDREPEYLEMLRGTAAEVARRVGLSDDRWRFTYQSAGHSPEEWLKPDIAELFPLLARSGLRDVLVAPVQFLADHLELLYDIDVAAREQAEQAGLELRRIEAFNVMPEFIGALADVVRRELDLAGWRSG